MSSIDILRHGLKILDNQHMAKMEKLLEGQENTRDRGVFDELMKMGSRPGVW